MFGDFSARGAKDARGNRLFLAQTEWRVTTKPGKLFVFFFSEPRAPFELPAAPQAVRRVYRLADKVPVDWKMDGGRIVLTLQRPMPDPMCSVFVVEFADRGGH